MVSAYRTMQEIAYDTIRKAILTGSYAPGQRLTLEDLAQELGTSPMPVREALKRLEVAGLVRITPHKGAVVSELSKKEIAEIYHMRAVLEGLATRLAAPRLTASDYEQLNALNEHMVEAMRDHDVMRAVEANQAFHEVIWQAADAPRLREALQNLTDASQRFRNISMAMPGRLAQIIEEHRRIAQALAAGDLSAAERLAIQHHENTAQRLLTEVERAEAASS